MIPKHYDGLLASSTAPLVDNKITSKTTQTVIIVCSVLGSVVAILLIAWLSWYCMKKAKAKRYV